MKQYTPTRSTILTLLILLTCADLRAADNPVRFTTDILPVLTKHGCNSGGCHGKATGQNGFLLSLFGFDPAADYKALVREAGGRRVFPGNSGQSLLVLKGTARVPHGGGRRLDADSPALQMLCRWIDEGAPGPQADDPVVERLVVEPAESVLSPNSQQQLRVTAHLSNNESREVTQLTVFATNEADVAECDKSGLVVTKDRGGLFAVMLQYGDRIGAFYGTVPFHAAGGENSAAATATTDAFAELERQLGSSTVDGHLLAQWKRLGILPSPPADDGAFIRRATIDICGILPSPSEVGDYIADSSLDKRARLIDRLLERPEYADNFATKWAAILRNRGSGYSTSKQREGTAHFTGWIRDSLAANKPYDEFVSQILTATGSQEENPPTVWYRQVRTTSDYVESIAQAFLGVRIQCAQCHHHPAERWSQNDYFSLAAVFARVGRKGGFADAEVPTNEIIYVKDRGEVLHPRTGAAMKPRALGGPDFDLGPFDDPRVSLARWMTAPENPFFARTMANRMWGHFLGRGIIHPIDDARSTNPPSNPALLDELSHGFVSSGYDVKHLIRTICNSYAYRLDAAPTASNGDDSQTFARFYPRRVAAEVLLDSISQVLDVPTEFPSGTGAFPAGLRATQLPDENVAVNFLDVFGRPARESACECERTDAPALGQALELVNSAEIQRKLTADGSFPSRLAIDNKPPDETVREIFLRVFARSPRDEERKAATEFLSSQPDRAEACRSLVWSLLATNEFLFNH